MLTGLLLRRRHGAVAASAVALLSYVAAVAGGALWLRGEDSPVVGVVVAVVATVPALVLLVAGPLAHARREGVEREVLWRATSVAFFAVMGAGLALGLLEGFAGLAPVSAWWLYGLGMVTWGVTSLVLDRRFR